MSSNKFYFYAPILFFISSWFFVFGLYWLTPYKFYHIKYETLFILVISILIIVLGYYFYRFFYLNEKIEINATFSSQPIRINFKDIFLVLVIINIIILISIILFIDIIASERGGISEYFANPIIARQLITKADSIGDWSPILSVSGYGVSLISISCIIGGILFSSNSLLHKISSIIPLLLSIIISVVKFSRYALLVSILYWFFSAFLFSYNLEDFHRRKTIRRLLFGSVFITISLSVIFYLILSLRFFIDPKNITEIFWLQSNYYIVGNIIALDTYLNNDISFHWGGGLLRTIIKWFARLGLYDQENVLSLRHPFVKISGSIVSNTYTYVRALYEDFGIIGLLMISFLWGIIAAKIMNNYLKNFNLVNLYLAVLVMAGFCLSFFSFFYLIISKIIYELIVLYLLQNYLSRKSHIFVSRA